MALDREKFIGKFIEEGLENTSTVETLILKIKDGDYSGDDLAALLRALHTLKGSSRMLEFKRIEVVTHSLENVFVAYKEQRIVFSENAVKLIISSLDLLKSGFASIQKTKDDAVEIDEHVKNLSQLAANKDFSVPKEAKKEVKSESIRISLDKIDGIIKSITSLHSMEISAKNISLDSALFNNMMKEYSKMLKNSKKSDPVMAASFRKLERLSDRLNTSLKNYAVDAGNNIRSAYDSVISLRTLPVSTIFNSYPRYVYNMSQELGKKIHLTIEGEENEIDRNIIEALSEVFLHMTRNSIDHGIETPKERFAAGKDETGNLSIVCSRESGNMKIVISDDGQGIDHEKIRRKAIENGLLTEAAAESISKEDLTNFIFRSGFSTSAKVSNISGRGVGMDVVRESIEALKGSIIVDTVVGQGTTFTITVPLSIAVLTGFPVECGKMKFIIPSNFIDNIMLLNEEEIFIEDGLSQIRYNDRTVKLYYLSQILDIKTENVQKKDTIYTIIVRSYDDAAAIVVDNIENMRSVILKTMPKFMENMSVFSGIVLNEDYEMVSVLHIPTVIRIAKHIKTEDIKKHNTEIEKPRKIILVVDDSRSTREIVSDILQSEGYITDTASDGAQALKAAESKHYDLICTDLNMPVMDGFLLLENLKKNEELSRIPVIVISSIENEEEHKRCFSMGASKYIVKNSFNNNNLLVAVNDLIGEKKEVSINAV